MWIFFNIFHCVSITNFCFGLNSELNKNTLQYQKLGIGVGTSRAENSSEEISKIDRHK